MAGDKESPIPKFSSFKPKKQVSKPTSSQHNDHNDSNNDTEAIMGRHRAGDRTRRAHRRTSRERRHDDHSCHATEARNERQWGETDRARHRERSPVRDATGRYERTFRDRGTRLGRDITKRHERTPRESNVSGHRNHSKDFYTIDLEGDSANLRYRRPDPSTVPMYHLYRGGSIILGLGSLGYQPRQQQQRQKGIEEAETAMSMMGSDQDQAGPNEHGDEEVDFLPMYEEKPGSQVPIITPKY
ncbi:hypothetical protein Q7P37_010424 [Cladosporium fusiforme]